MRGVRGGSLIALSAGLLQTASFAPLEAWPLQIAAMALLVVALRGAQTTRRAAWLGGLFAFAGFASGLWWLYVSMHDFGHMPAPLAALAVAALSALLALYYAGAAALWKRFVQGQGPYEAIGFAACWTLAELARGQLFTGFPWNAGGYAHTTGWLLPWAPWVGVYGIGAIAAWCGAALGLMRRDGVATLVLVLPPLVMLAAGALLPRDFTRATGALKVSLLQTMVSQDLKFDIDRFAAQLGALDEALRAAKGDLVVTPESVLPVPLAELAPETWQGLTAGFRSGGRAALIGVFLGNSERGYVNSLAGISERYSAAPGGQYAYGKRHLLPFGEFVPPGFRWFVDLMQIPLGDQEHGTSDALFEVDGQRLRPLICYEDLFGEDFVESVVGANSATVLVNVSNLAWFGRYMAQDQHLQASRMRALEFQRPVIRATNTGATAVVDHEGRVAARLAPDTRGVLEASVQGRRGDTPYARWLAALGLMPVWVINAGIIGALAWRRRAQAAPTGAERTRYR